MPESTPIRWYHQSWAVIGGLLLAAGVFAFSLQSGLFLVIYGLIVVASGVWLYFGTMDGTLTSDRPAILEMRSWLSDGAPPLLPDHGAFVYLGEPSGLRESLARALERWGTLREPDDPDVEHARLVFVGPGIADDQLARLQRERDLWSRTVVLLPPGRPADEARRLLGSRDVPADAPGGVVVAARTDGVPLDAHPVESLDHGALGRAIARARPDLVHGPSAAPGATIVVDTRRAPRFDDGSVVVPVWLQPTEARLGAVRELVLDGERRQIRVPRGVTSEQQVRVPCQVRRGSEWSDLVLEVEVS